MKPVAFWSVCGHHTHATRPIYDKMKASGKPVKAFFGKPFKTVEKYRNVVASTAQVSPTKRKDTIYHFHSLSPYHTNPHEQDYRFIPLFKAVMFPGEWWVNKWNRLPKHWAVVGWPKTDFIIKQKSKTLGKAVLYAPCMFNGVMHGYRTKTLRLLLRLSKSMSFTLIFKAHGGLRMWFPKEYRALVDELKGKKNVRFASAKIDVASLFGDADVLVSAASGALWEFMATGKPSILLTHAGKWGRTYPGGVLKANFQNLHKVLKKCFENPQICKDTGWREKVMGKLDGKATERAIKFIEEVF